MKRKQISFPVSEEEHEQIKSIASEQRRTIKQLFFGMLDKLHPNWDKKENGSK